MIRKLAGCVRQYKLVSILTPIFMIGEVLMEVIIPLLMARLVDQGISPGNMNAIVLYGAAMVGCAVLSLFCGAMSGRCAAKASAGFASNIRHDMYHNVQTFSFANIDKFSTSSIITRLTTDVTNVQNAYQMLLRMAVRGPMMLIFSLVMVFSINGSVAPVFLAVIPVLAIGLIIISKSAFPIFSQMMKKYDRLNTVVEENLRGIRVVKAYVREDHEIEKFTTASGEILENSSKAEKILAFNSPLMQGSMYVSILIISWMGARMIIQNTMSTGELMSILSYTGQLLMSLMMLSMVFVMLTMSQASMKRIVEILDERATITNGEKAIAQVKDGAIRFENVAFRYKQSGNPVLSNINLDIASGQTVGILGSTGSGKTSLVQMIPRLYDATEGRVLVGGVDVKDYDLVALRDAVSVVLQKNELFSGTIKDNLRWGNENATDEEILQACQIAQADEFIRTFPDGYDTHIEQGGTNVSGGQKQRLCIARALLKKPKVLILDDSTSAVDTHTDSLIRQGFKNVIPGTTKIIIAQRVSSVQEADQIIVLDDGQISAVGSHEELLKTSEIYREVYESQQSPDADGDEKGEDA